MRADAQTRGSFRGPGIRDSGSIVLNWLIGLTTGVLLLSPLAHSKRVGDGADSPELSYLLFPTSGVKFHYHVRRDTFFSKALGKEKDYFLIFPEVKEIRRPTFPLLVLLHGYNFYRNGWKFTVCEPKGSDEITCAQGEEHYHWLTLEDIVLIHQAMTSPSNTTYGKLEVNLRERFEELKAHGGLIQDDYSPEEIARSIVRDNLNSHGSPSDSFTPIYPMILLLPDGDNSFYADENEGRPLFPPTVSRIRGDHFLPDECFKYSLIPLQYMKPGALGQYGTYLLELIHFLLRVSPYRDDLMEGVPVGVGGFSMGGFGAMNLGLRYRSVFGSISSQSGLLDIELLTDKLMLKIIMPEFLEVFGGLNPRVPFYRSNLDREYIRENNPIRRIQALEITSLPPWMYFDYGTNEGFEKIIRGNQNLEKLLGEGSHGISPKELNGDAGHNYQFWRSRAGNVLLHHSRFFKGCLTRDKATDGRNTLQ
jgi:enterochelin esterase-like enzyme